MKNKKILLIGLIVILISILYMPKAFATAASASLKASNNNPSAGESVTVTATAVAGGFNLTLSGNGETKQIVGQTDTTDNVSKSTSITFTAEEGKTYTFNLTGDYTDFYKDDATSVNEKVTVNVKATEAKPVEEPKKEETPEEQPKTEETPAKQTKTETPQQEDPNFKETNQTMYMAKNGNLRESWSTSSAATYIEKGTELNVTATSTKTVNGYIWYRVSYQGKTRYIANFLLTSEKPEEEQKSNNANLKTLTIEGLELIPEFSSNVTSYTVQVPEETTKIEVKAETEEEKSVISIKGNDNLSSEGENIVTVSVSAEDGTVKIYEIKVEKVSQKVQSLGLKSLNIEGTSINSKFNPNTYNYEIDIEPDVTDLKIEAVPNDETSTVEVLGNENFQDGENLVTIIVSSQNGEDKVTYQIKANRKEQTVEASTKNNTEKKSQNYKTYIYIGVGAIVFIALIIVVVYTIKHRNQYKYDDELYYLPEKLPERKIDDVEESNNQRNNIETRKKGKHF